MVRGNSNLGKVLDLFSYDADTSFVGGVQFEDTRSVQFRTKELLAECEDCRGFTRSGRTVE